MHRGEVSQTGGAEKQELQRDGSIIDTAATMHILMKGQVFSYIGFRIVVYSAEANRWGRMAYGGASLECSAD